MKWVYDDGGRSKYFKGTTGDCVCRAISIAEGKDYKEVYNLINMYAEDYRHTENPEDNSHARYGVSKVLTEKILNDLGYKWVPKMYFGKGCTTHLRDGELPSKGKIIARVSKHITCIIDNVIYDIYDPSRGGSRCVYGFYVKV